MSHPFRFRAPFPAAAAALVLAALTACTTTGSATGAYRRARPESEPVLTRAHAPYAPATDEDAAPASPAHLDTVEPEPAPAPPPPAPGVSAESLSEDELCRAVQSAIVAGRESLAQSDSAAARERFDAAVELLVDSHRDLETEPRLQTLWNEALLAIRDLEALEAQQEEEAEEAARPHEETAVEAIAEVEPETMPEPAAAAAPVHVGPYTIPVDLNAKVLSFIEAFQGKLREPISRGLHRSGRYIPMIEKTFEEEGIPKDLVYLALCESNFNPTALSRAGARGLWQFIPSTGRRYGLTIDWWVDERSDPEKATRAAARYLKDLYGMFGDWYLAMASYNAGEGKVGGIVRRTGLKDFWSIAASRNWLRAETRNYVPAILAAVVIGNNPQAYGFEPLRAEPEAWEPVPVDGSTDLTVLAECAGTDFETLRALNPELRRTVTPDRAYMLKVPRGTRESFLAAYSVLPADKRIPWVRHKVRKSETIASIARKYDVSVSTVLQVNSLRQGRKLPIGRTLMIPTGGEYAVQAASLACEAEAAAARVDAVSTPATGSRRVTHVVRRGETLSSIARRYGTSVTRLTSLNGLSSKHRIYAGQRLTVAVRSGSGAARTASAARSTSAAAAAPSAKKLVHLVRRGDTLSAIAVRYGTTVANLRRWNGISPGEHILAGQRIVLYSRR